MTTDANHLLTGVTRVLVAAATVSVAAGLVVAATGWLVAGSAAALGALVGTVAVVVIFAFGAFVVNAIAALMPSAALMVALLTYTLQVAAMALFFVALTQSGALDDGTIDREWLAGSIIVGTFVWITLQVVMTTRQRTPIYDIDLPVAPSQDRG